MGMMLGRLQMMKGAHGKRTYTLLGTEVSPRSRSHQVDDPDDCEIDWHISGRDTGSRTSGYVQYDERAAGDAATYTNSHAFTNPVDDWGTLYFRLTYGSGSDTVKNSSHAIDGSTWHALTEDTNDIWWTTDHTSVAGTTTTLVKVEMATDSGGTDIVDTGWYQAICDVASGA